MSWDFDLTDPVTKETLQTEQPHHMFGGIVTVGGETAMTLNITYNYNSIISNVMDIEWAEQFNDMPAAESIPILKGAISKLKDDVDEDYWKATEGNAKRALYQLLALAQMRPDGVWRVF